jgi:uncharacterized protein (TIGR00106 family)
VIAAFSVTPLGGGEAVGDLVAECVRIVRESGLPNETNAMFTNLEGGWDEVMAVIKACVEAVTADAPRASVVVKIDALADDPGGRMAAKVESVERRLSQGNR